MVTGAIFQCDSSFELLWRDFIYLYKAITTSLARSESLHRQRLLL